MLYKDYVSVPIESLAYDYIKEVAAEGKGILPFMVINYIINEKIKTMDEYDKQAMFSYLNKDIPKEVYKLYGHFLIDHAAFEEELYEKIKLCLSSAAKGTVFKIKEIITYLGTEDERISKRLIRLIGKRLREEGFIRKSSRNKITGKTETVWINK